MPTETTLRLRAAMNMLNGYAGASFRFSFEQTEDHNGIVLKDDSGSRVVYSETDRAETEYVTPEQVAYNVGQNLYQKHPSFSAEVIQDLQNKKDYYARD